MHVNYRLTFIDLLLFNFYHQPRAVLNQVVWAGSVFLLGRTFWSIESPIYVKLIMVFLVVLFITVAWTVLILLTVIVSYRRAKNRAIYEETKLSLDGEGVTDETPLGHSRMSWRAVPKIAATSKLVLIYTQQNGAHIVPKRAFASAADADAFLSFAKKAWHAAQAAPN